MAALLAFLSLLQDPAAVDDRLTVELVARDPDVVTPVGLAVDPRGRIWVVESHTHMRPTGYAGPTADRLRVLENFAPDGRARTVRTFADGFPLGMGVGFDAAGDVVLVTRDAILKLRDSDGDGTADERRVLVRLETSGTYDHNGLFGPAFDAAGDLYFALGGNTSGEFPLGAPYTLRGSDGSTAAGDEGGRIFTCRGDGSNLKVVALGFWNPFHLAFDGFGRLFAVDNDPDERPPCRLLHVVPDGDFGFRRRNGPRGLHPFTSWDGELPGTLPMVAGTGEAPSGIVACETPGLPADYRGALLVTAWGDHEVQRFRLAPRGASFTSKAEPVVRGGRSFRPVGIAVAPDGSVVVSDWVGSYPVHGKGAIWRIRARAPATDPPAARPRLQSVRADPERALRDPAEEIRGEAARVLAADDPRRPTLAASDPSPFVRMQALLGARLEPRRLAEIVPLLADPDPFLVHAAADALARSGDAPRLAGFFSSDDPKVRLGLLLVLRRLPDGQDVESALAPRLRDPDPGVRRAAVQWVAETRRLHLLEAVSEAAARPPHTIELFRAILAAQDFRNPEDRRDVDGALNEAAALKVVDDPTLPVRLRAFALRHVQPGHPALTTPRLRSMLESADPILRLEAVRALAGAPGDEPQERLRGVAVDRRQPSAVRAEALSGLARSASVPATRHVLLSVRDGEAGELRREALRALAEPAEDAEGAPPDPLAGERLFYHPRGPQCFVCHRVNGRGGTLGPDLTFAGRAARPEKLLESVLEPSKEIAPSFLGWEIVTREGETFTGRIDKESADTIRLVMGMGVRFTLKKDDVRMRRALHASLMPEGLHRMLGPRDLRDLIAFLSELR